MDRNLILFGVLWLILSLGFGYVLVSHPEGLNPEWPPVVAWFALSVFPVAGLFLLAEGFGFHGFGIAMLRIILVCFFVMFNWAAFFTKDIQCRESFSFIGIPIFENYPTAEECSARLKVIIGCIDGLILFVFAAFFWQKRKKA